MSTPGKHHNGQPRPLWFEDPSSSSATRARNTGTVIKRYSGARFDIALTDADLDDPHEVRLVHLPNADGYHGSCDCEGFRYNGGACAHLWAVYYSEQFGAVDIPEEIEALSRSGECPTCGREVNRA